MEWDGVGLLPFLPCKTTGGHALKAAFVTEGFPIYHLTVENSPSVAAKTWALGMFKLRAKNNVHLQVRAGKKNVLYHFFPIYACPLFAPYRPPEKMSTPIP